MTSENSIFSSFVKSDQEKNSDGQIEKKFNIRAENISNQTANMEDINEQAILKDLSLKKDDRENQFKEKRLRQKIKLDYTASLKDKLTIPLHIYEVCNKLKVQVKVDNNNI
jgi:hypothetical protein